MNGTDINDLLQATTTAGPVQPSPPRDELGQEQFLELMIAQFRNQDPFEPMTNGDFLGQLAQFSTVSGVQDLQTSFNTLADAISGEQALQAGSLVGKDILSQSEFAEHSAADPLRGVIELDGAARSVEIDLISSNGELVRTLSLGDRGAGTTEFEWDGLTADGDEASPGSYQLVVRVQRGDFVETVPALIRSRVDSVSLGNDGRGIRVNTTNAGSLLFNQIDRIL